MIIGWNGETLPDLPLDEEIEIASEAGYGGIEIFIPKLAPFLEKHGAAALARRLQEHGLKALTMNGVENVNLRPPEEFAQVREECRRLADVSQAIGCPTIVIVPSPWPQGSGWAEIRSATASEVAELADAVAPFGVRLAFEFLGPATCSVRTLSQGWEIVQATGRENVGLVFDTYHFHVGGSSWESLEQLDAERLYIVHINDVEDLPLDQLTDGHRLLPGEGILPLAKMFSHLHAGGYDGAYSLEVMRPAYRQRDPLEYARAGLQACRRALREAGLV